MPYLFPVSEGYTFDLTECFVIGDIKVYNDNIFHCLVEFECRRPDQYIMIYDYKWQANIIQKNGAKDAKKIIKNHKLTSESGAANKLLFFIFDQDEAIDCVMDKKLPQSYVSFDYNDKVRKLPFRLESSKDAAGEIFWEYKAKLPYKLAYRNTLTPFNNYKRESYAEYVENI